LDRIDSWIVKSEVIHSFQIDSEVVPVAELRGHDDAVQAVVFDPNGNFMISGSSDSTFRIWGNLEVTPESEAVMIEGVQSYYPC